MSIVVLDGYTLNPGDLSWEEIEKLGELKVYDYTSTENIVERARDAEIVLLNKTLLGEKEMSRLEKLKYIGVLATGYNVVDVGEARRRNITVTHIPSYGTRSVAQMTFALLLELTSRVQHHSDAVFAGEWTKCRDFCFWKYPLIELEGKTMGIIGFGRIGQAVADVAEAFGMKVLGCSRSQTDQSHRRQFKWADLQELLRESDVISLHCPLLPETRGLINRETLQKMKPTAFLINTGRGLLIEEKDLADALNAGAIAGAGLDVLSEEPPNPGNPLLNARNCLITPHISWATKEARTRLMAIAADNVAHYLRGNPVNVVG